MSEVLQLVEEALDAVAQPIGQAVMGNDDVAGPGGGDHRLGSGVADRLALSLVVVGFVGDDAAGVATGEEVGGSSAVMRLGRPSG